LAAADKLAEENIDAEVIDLRTIRPLDLDALLGSVTKTHRAVIVEEDWPYCGLGAGIADRITERVFDELDAPIRRVAAKDAPIPYNRMLESSMLPSVERIIAAAHDVLYI
jgi:pyruvate dehydrogenase E1 component beta subunit